MNNITLYETNAGIKIEISNMLRHECILQFEPLYLKRILSVEK